MADKILVQELYPKVEKSLSQKSNTDKLKKSISAYLDRNTEKLTTIGPIYRILFSEYDAAELYDVVGTTPQEIKIMVKKSSEIKDQWQIMNDPFNSVASMAIRYYTIHNNVDMNNSLLIYLTMSMYPSLHFKYFKYEPNENIMNYTINNLSNKFKIKQTGTIYAALIETVKGSYELHKSSIIRGEDKDIVKFIMDVKTRLNSLLKKIANEFYENEKQKKYINLDTDSYDEDNYHEADNNMFAVERITNQIVLKLVVEGPSIQLINLSAKFCQVSVSELRNYVNSMVNGDNKEDIKQIIESILFLYLYDGQNKIEDINTNKFFMYCMEIYKKSNTVDKNIIKIKNILDEWLTELGTYKKTERLATINNFRRALFTFFVISIEKYAN